MIRAINVRSSLGAPPDESVSELTQLAAPVRRVRALMYRPTSPDVIRTYLYVKFGQRCSEYARIESERVLRLQPFLADARIRVTEVGRDTVQLDVLAEDEFQFNVAGSFRSGSPSGLSVGNSNIAGHGVSATLTYERGFAYRDGIGAHLVTYAAFGEPWILTLDATRRKVGGQWEVSLAQPFYSNIKSRTGYLGAVQRHAFDGLEREHARETALETRRLQGLAGLAWRLRKPEHAWVAGPFVQTSRTRSATSFVIVSDSGIVTADVPDAAAPYSYSAVRAGALLGFRSARHVFVRGFDALSGSQDLTRGVDATAFAAQWLSGDDDHTTAQRDLLLGVSAYAGHARETELLAIQASGEVSVGESGGGWRGALLGARGAWYVQPSPDHLRVVSAELAGTWHSRLPTQLSFSDNATGMHGFGNAQVGGAQRLIVRTEERFTLGHPWDRGDLGAAGFVELGKLWAGDAPFGVTTGMQASIGVSLLAAMPRGSRRLWRVDFSVPLTHAGEPSKFEFRASIGDHTRTFWREPPQLERAREGALLPRMLGDQ